MHVEIKVTVAPGSQPEAYIDGRWVPSAVSRCPDGRSLITLDQPAQRLDDQAARLQGARVFMARCWLDQCGATVFGLHFATEAAAVAALDRIVPPATSIDSASDDDRERLLAVASQLDPQFKDGALLYIPHLRAALAPEWPESGRFERAVLGLVVRRTLQAQAHPTPAALKPEEKAAMIVVSSGMIYMAIGLVRR